MRVHQLLEAFMLASPSALAECKRLIRDVAGQAIAAPIIDETIARLAAQRATPDGREQAIHYVASSPLFMSLTGGAVAPVNSAGVPWSGAYVNANGDPTVDLRSNIAAESRAKIVYEYLKQFTADPGIQDTLTFLMTREVAHFQQFTAALNELPENFPPGKLPGDDRFQNLAFNMSDGGQSFRGPWNEGQGPWPQGVQWRYVEQPVAEWLSSAESANRGDQISANGQPAVQGSKPFVHQEHIPT